MTHYFGRIFSAIALLLLSPVFLLIGLFIKLDSPGPVFHRAQRVGVNGNLFLLYKFRTMVVDSRKSGPGITRANDERVTNVGRILRRTKLDELPQLLNVVRGDMALVGPRPEDPRYVGFYTAEQRRVLSVRPGITSAASLYFRDEERLLVGDDWEQMYRNEILPQKLAIDLDYLVQRTPISDMKLIVNTVFAMLD